MLTDTFKWPIYEAAARIQTTIEELAEQVQQLRNAYEDAHREAERLCLVGEFEALFEPARQMEDIRELLAVHGLRDAAADVQLDGFDLVERFAMRLESMQGLRDDVEREPLRLADYLNVCRRLNNVRFFRKS